MRTYDDWKCRNPADEHLGSHYTEEEILRCEVCGYEITVEVEPLNEEPDLSEIHAWQATPEGVIALRVADLMTAISELKQLADNPNVMPLVAAERADIELASAALTRLLARVPS